MVYVLFSQSIRDYYEFTCSQIAVKVMFTLTEGGLEHQLMLRRELCYLMLRRELCYLVLNRELCYLVLNRELVTRYLVVSFVT